jgi:hypothetical protein
MFDFIESTVNNILDVGEGFLDGELPSKQQVAKLASDGLSIYAISEATGIAVNVIEGFLED